MGLLSISSCVSITCTCVISCAVVAKTQGLKSQYTPVETKPGSGAAKVVMDSTRVVYSEVDKDKLKPVDSNDPPGIYM